MKHLVFLFGEAEKGQMCHPVPCRDVSELMELYGNPPPDSMGIFYAIQALLYQRGLLYFRVREEGFSTADYTRGLHMLRNKEISEHPAAICMPGMGDSHIIHEASEVCFLFRSLFLTSEKDFYDYLTN
jgi:hypothetical protein